MPDIFDQVAPDKPAAAPPAQGDIFDQVFPDGSKLPPTRLVGAKPSDSLPQPEQADADATALARGLADAATRPGHGVIAPVNPNPLEQLWSTIRDSSIGHAFGVDTRTDETRHEQGNRMVNFEAAVPGSQPSALRGAAQFASDLTTPDNLLLMLGMPQGLIGRLASLGFSSQMLVDSAKQVPGFVDALKKGDYATARQIGTKVALQTVAAIMGVKHAGAREKAEPTATSRQIEAAETPVNPNAPHGGANAP